MAINHTGPSVHARGEVFYSRRDDRRWPGARALARAAAALSTHASLPLHSVGCDMACAFRTANFSCGVTFIFARGCRKRRGGSKSRFSSPSFWRGSDAFPYASEPRASLRMRHACIPSRAPARVQPSGSIAGSHVRSLPAALLIAPLRGLAVARLLLLPAVAAALPRAMPHAAEAGADYGCVLVRCVMVAALPSPEGTAGAAPEVGYRVRHFGGVSVFAWFHAVHSEQRIDRSDVMCALRLLCTVSSNGGSSVRAGVQN